MPLDDGLRAADSAGNASESCLMGCFKRVLLMRRGKRRAVG